MYTRTVFSKYYLLITAYRRSLCSRDPSSSPDDDARNNKQTRVVMTRANDERIHHNCTDPKTA